MKIFGREKYDFFDKKQKNSKKRKCLVVFFFKRFYFWPQLQSAKILGRPDQQIRMFLTKKNLGSYLKYWQ